MSELCIQRLKSPAQHSSAAERSWSLWDCCINATMEISYLDLHRLCEIVSYLSVILAVTAPSSFSFSFYVPIYYRAHKDQQILTLYLHRSCLYKVAARCQAIPIFYGLPAKPCPRSSSIAHWLEESLSQHDEKTENSTFSSPDRFRFGRLAPLCRLYERCHQRTR